VLDAFTWSRYRDLLAFAEQAYADVVSDSQGQVSSSRKGSTALITDARTPASAELSSRVRRYTITMAFRTACFIAMVFVDGPLRWVLFACALVLPYIAVILANQANQRSIRKQASFTVPADRPQLTAGPSAPPGADTNDRDRRDQAVV
jgi:Protein of unknown function (DUF3099)